MVFTDIRYDTILHLLFVKGCIRKMVKQHGSSSTKALLKQLSKEGFVISEKSKRGTIKITPPKHISGPIYCTHATESAYHGIRRDVVKLYGIKI